MTPRLWWVRPESFQATPAALALLDSGERQQHQRYIPPAKQHEYLVTRVLVRSVLGKILGMPPATLHFVQNKWGRPALAPGLAATNIHFNVSHTDGLVVCLVSTKHEVGVDTERLSRAPTLLRLAPNVFASDELAALSALPEKEQAQRAVHLWTLKESYIKARGMGLAIPLDGFAFGFEQEGIRLKISPDLKDEGANWAFQSHTIGHHLISTTIARSAQNESSGTTIHFAEFDISAFCPRR